MKHVQSTCKWCCWTDAEWN